MLFSPSMKPRVAYLAIPCGLVCFVVAGCGGGGGAGPADMAIAPPMADMMAQICRSVPILGPQQPNYSASCLACVHDNCCQETTDCADNSDCVGLRKCLAAAKPNIDCYKVYMKGRPENNPAAAAVQMCISGAGCAGPCGGDACSTPVMWPVPKKPTYTFTLSLVLYDNASPVVGATVKVCPLSDLTCAAPLMTATSDGVGSVKVTAPSSPHGIDAYLDVTGAGVQPTLSYIFDATAAATLDGGKYQLVYLTNPNFLLFAGQGNIVPDLKLSMVFFNAIDCEGQASGLGVDVSPAASQTIYFSGGEISKTATITDFTGAGAIYNVMPGMIKLTGANSVSNKVFSTETAGARSGYITSIAMIRTP